MSDTNPSTGHCPRCGDANPYTAMVCTGCGSRLPWADAIHAGRQSSLTSQQTHPLTPTQRPVVPSPTLPHQTHCTHCGASNTDGVSFCSSCGKSIVAAWISPATTSQQPSVNVSVNVKQNNNGSWLAALLVLLFGTPLGCLVVPAVIVVGIALIAALEPVVEMAAVTALLVTLVLTAIAAAAVANMNMEPQKKRLTNGAH